MQPSDKQITTLDTISLIISGCMPALDGDSFSNEGWDALARKASSEGVGPLLFWTLSNSGKFATLPKATQNFLRNSYVRTLVNNQSKLKELETLTQLFDQAEIPTVALKGVCFALTIYPNIGLRPMKDMDILVPKMKLVEAVNIAKTLGYEENSHPFLSPGLRDLLSHHIFLQKKGDAPIVLELHHNLVAYKSYSHSVPVDWFWEQTESLGGDSQIRFKNLRMLTPTAQALYAASHAMLQHGEKDTPLSWFYDLDQLVRFYAERMDWDLLLSQARIFEWGSALKGALSRTQAYFNTPIPKHVNVSLAENSDRNLRIILLKQTQPVTYIHGAFQRLATLNWYGRFRLLLAHIVPSPAYMRLRYNFSSSWALPAYYLFRWCEILKDVLYAAALLLKRSSTKRS